MLRFWLTILCSNHGLRRRVVRTFNPLLYGRFYRRIIFGGRGGALLFFLYVLPFVFYLLLCSSICFFPFVNYFPPFFIFFSFFLHRKKVTAWSTLPPGISSFDMNINYWEKNIYTLLCIIKTIIANNPFNKDLTIQIIILSN